MCHVGNRKGNSNICVCSDDVVLIITVPGQNQSQQEFN